MRLRFKILSGFLILALMLSIAGIWSIYKLKSMSSSVQGLLKENYKSINAAKIMTESLEREDSAILLLLLGNWNEGRKILLAADSLFKEGFSIAKNNVTIPGEEILVKAIETKYNAYKGIWESPLTNPYQRHDMTWYLENAHNAFLDLKSNISDLMTINDKFMFETASGLKEEANRAIMPGVVAIISALIFTLLFNYFINFYFVNPIIRINRSIKEAMANKGKFDVEIDTKDEITELAESVRTLFNSIKTQA